MVEKQYDTFWRRIGARCIDAFIIGFVFGIVNMIFILINSKLTYLLPSIALFILLIYNFWFHYRYGQTIGKRIMEIKVLNISESRINFLQIIIRETLIFIVFYSYSIYRMWKNQNFTRLDIIMVGIFNIALLLIDLSIIAINNRKRALHDLIAKTVVVRID